MGNQFLKKLIKNSVARIWESELIKNRYFIFGLAVQKSTPFLAIPFVVDIFGGEIYSDYVLIFSSVQVLATVTSMAVTSAVIPLWHYQKDVKIFATAILTLILFLFIVFLSPSAVVLLFLMQNIQISIQGISLVIWLLFFSLLYNINVLFVSFQRVKGGQIQFFQAVCVSIIAYISLISVFGYFGNGDLEILLSIHIFTLVLLNCFLWPGRKSLDFNIAKEWNQIQHLWKEILRLSWPISIYTLTGLLAMTFDKWIVKLGFKQSEFLQYVLDYQFSISLMLLPMAIAFYNSAIVSELVAKGNTQELADNISKNKKLCLWGMCIVAVCVYYYAKILNINLSWGYWMLAVGFSLEGIYSLYFSVLMAQKKSHIILFIMIISCSFYIVILFISMKINSISLVYISNLIYTSLLFLMSWFYMRSRSIKTTNC